MAMISALASRLAVGKIAEENFLSGSRVIIYSNFCIRVHTATIIIVPITQLGKVAMQLRM
jgi:hypothetical protein